MQHQNVQRFNLVLQTISAAGDAGLRPNDLIDVTGLSKASVYRILSSLVEYQLIIQNTDNGRYFLSYKILAWAGAAIGRNNLIEITAPSLARLKNLTEDTVYLVFRSNDQSVCVSRREGSFPIKALILHIGQRYPLGVGASSVAMLMSLTDEEVKKIIERNRLNYPRYYTSAEAVINMVKRSQDLGFSLNDGEWFPGMTSVALPILTKNGFPVASISVAALSSRMANDRMGKIVEQIREEVQCVQLLLKEHTEK